MLVGCSGKGETYKRFVAWSDARELGIAQPTFDTELIKSDPSSFERAISEGRTDLMMAYGHLHYEFHPSRKVEVLTALLSRPGRTHSIELAWRYIDRIKQQHTGTWEAEKAKLRRMLNAEIGRAISLDAPLAPGDYYGQAMLTIEFGDVSDVSFSFEFENLSAKERIKILNRIVQCSRDQLAQLPTEALNSQADEFLASEKMYRSGLKGIDAGRLNR